MRKLHAIIGLALLGASSAAMSQVPLNTGFNNGNFTTYFPSGSPDNYWIKVASSNTGTGPAFVIPHQFWQQPLTLPPADGGFGSTWVGPTSTGTSPTGQFSWAVFRKCFCLTRNYKQPKLDFQLRADDMVGVWLNNAGAPNNIVPLQGGSFSGPAISGAANPSQFQTGRNCLYVLVVDTGSVVTGFNLAGKVSAFGLMPMAAAGTGGSFAPCQCDSGGKAEVLADKATIQAIVKVAQASQGGATPPSKR